MGINQDLPHSSPHWHNARLGPVCAALARARAIFCDAASTARQPPAPGHRRFTNLAGILLIGAASGLAACSSLTGSAPIAPSRSAQDDTTMGKQPLPQFTDIPIPAGARMDLDRSLVLGPRESWIGRLVFTSGAGPNDMFEFYNRELPRFGWTAITAVRAGTSVLSYTRGERVATVQIGRTTLGGSEVLITISPRSGSALDPGGAQAPATAPVSRQPLR